MEKISKAPQDKTERDKKQKENKKEEKITPNIKKLKKSGLISQLRNKYDDQPQEVSYDNRDKDQIETQKFEEKRMQRRAYDKKYKKVLNQEKTKFQKNELTDWTTLNDIKGSFQEKNKKINKHKGKKRD